MTIAMLVFVTCTQLLEPLLINWFRLGHESGKLLLGDLHVFVHDVCGH